MITTTAPRTGLVEPTHLRATEPDEVARICAQMDTASPRWSATSRAERADTLDAIADKIDEHQGPLIDAADRETALGVPRLSNELNRASNQFRFFADVIREGGYLEAAIDHAAETPAGVLPELRRMLVPIGPVAVFGASNFPFAFSVIGGDTASALAAGCPVVVKAHESHPLTAELSHQILAEVIRDRHGDDGVIQIVYGRNAGAEVLRHPAVRGAGFTGSHQGATGLREVIRERADPIPFFGELSSINPLMVTRGAAEARGGDIADGFFESITGSGGQLCTKPGIILVPDGAAGDALLSRLEDRISSSGPFVLLNRRIQSSYEEISAGLAHSGGLVAAIGRESVGEGISVSAQLLTTTAASFSPALADECFGPLAIAVRYTTIESALDTIAKIPSSLTASIHGEPNEDGIRDVLEAFRSCAGRVIFNGYPTGVRVSWAQHHGGPWPATDSQHSSVGATAIRRWLRPLAWQNVPSTYLPEELRDDQTRVPTRVDGVLRNIG